MFYTIEQYISYSSVYNHHMVLMAAIDPEIELKTFHKAIRCPQRRDAMLEEIQDLELNATWPAQNFPPGKYPVGCE